jgi:hypothetical protein
MLRDLFAARLTAQISPSAISAHVSASELSESQVTTIRYVSAALFVAAALTVFLPYFAIERKADVSTGAPSYTYHYSGITLISGSYKNSHPDAAFYANDGRFLPFMILILSVLGRVTVPARRHRAVAWVLFAFCIVVVIGGCAATSTALDFFNEGWVRHLDFGFILASLLLIAAAGVRFYLWRAPKASDEGRHLPR